jgi:amino acid adenylation domain-containing protein
VVAVFTESSVASSVDITANVPADGPARSPGFPLSYGQRALWFLDRLSPGNPAYGIAGAARARRGLDGAALRRAAAALVARHPALRTTFHPGLDGPVQRVSPEGEVEILEEEVSGLTEPELRDHLSAVAFRPFDLERGPLLRLALFRLASGEHAMVLAIHHIVADFWSLGVLVRELGALYGREAGITAEAGPLLPPPPEIDFAAVVKGEEELLAGPRGQALWESRRAALASFPLVLDLPTDRPRPPIQSYRGAGRSPRLAPALVDSLRRLARQRGATLYMALLAAYQALLQRYSGQDRLVVGCPTTGRGASVLAGLVGYLVNPVAIPGDLTGEPGYAELLGRTRAAALAAFADQAYPLPLLAERLQPERDPGRSPVFQVVLVLQKGRRSGEDGIASLVVGEDGAPIDFGPLRLESLGLAEPGVQFDLAVAWAESGGGLSGRWQYNRDLFEAPTMERMAGHFASLLAAIVAAPPGSPALPVAALPLLGEGERAQLLWEWNDTVRMIPDGPGGPSGPEPLVHERFAEQARRRPWATAMVTPEGRLTYGELYERSQRLAGQLRELGVGPEVLVAVCASRALTRLVGLVAVLAAGGAYVPLDPTYPAERSAYILADTRAPVLLTEGSLAGRLPAAGATIVCLEDDGPATAEPLPRAGGAVAENLAYVVYTSGSTGRPKGVAVSHAGLANITCWHRDYYGLGPEDRTTQLASPAFDASVAEIWPALVAGTSLHVPDAATRLSAPETLRWWAEQGITVGWLMTPLAEAILEEEIPPGLHLRLRTLLTGGDRLRRRPRPDLPFRLVNNYGPTEASVVCLATPVGPGEGMPPIGRPKDDTFIHVLDPHGQPVPIGVPGELYVAGAGLARGYHGRPEQTAERFVPDPWGALSGEPGARMYRTGDRVRHGPDGNLEFLGRADHQVKLRGFRIELGEIEIVLAGHPAVREAVALACENRPGDLRLVAYVVPGEAPGPSAAELRAYLGERLPEYMLPAGFVLLEALPLSPNGKVDRDALARLAPVENRPEGGRMAPRGPVEELLAGIWSEVLGVERVGVADDFFHLGGHSLLATRVAARIRQAFSVDLPLPRLFAASTLGALAREVAALQSAGTRPEAPIRPQPRPPGERLELPLSPAQERLWFVDRLAPGSPAYNLPGAVHLAGRLDVPALAAALAGICGRHETLRTTFAETNFAEAAGGRGERGAVQEIAPPSTPDLPVVDLAPLPPGARAAELRRLGAAEAARPFDLAAGPLLRTTLVRLGEEEHAFFLNLHHIVADGWSIGVLVREMGAFYRTVRQGLPVRLPELPVQYGDFAVWQREQLTGDALARQLAWWRERLVGAPALLELPADRPRPAVQSQRGGRFALALDAGLRGRLAALGRRGEATLFMTLLTAWKALLLRTSGQEDLVVGSPVAGRDRAEIFGLIGFFAGTVALRTDLGGDPGFSAAQARVRDGVLGALAHPDLPFERLVEELAPERRLSHAPLVQVVFALQATPFPAFDLPGLTARRIDLPRETAKFDLALELAEQEGEDGRLAGDLEYSRDLWDGTTIARLAGHFERLLAGIVIAPETPLSRLPLLSAAERSQLLVEWSDTGRPARFVPVHELVLEQARRRPGAIAVQSPAGMLTYGELAARAGRLARHLRHLGVGGVEPEVPVAILLAPSPQQMVAALAVLLAGGAYLPLDPAYPAERLRFILEDAGATVAVTRGGLAGRLPGTGRIVDIDIDLDLGPEALPGAVTAPPASDPASLAYVVYTSGSTGRPKGVEIPHGGFANVVRWFQGFHRITPEDRATLVASPAFDAAVVEIWPFLASGASLHVPDPETRLSAPALLSWWAREGITLPFLPTPLAEAVLDEELPAGGLALRALFVGGDRLHRRPDPGHRFVLFNHYGPSEYSVATTAATVLPAAPGETGVPSVPSFPSVPSIGRPIANTRLAVLDRGGEPVPMGVPGELQVGGAGLARGYRGRPDLTAERFVPDPAAGRRGEPGARRYRTGDLVRFLPDGELDFLGRIDRQVKLRGFRIELGEIEAVLAAHEAVEQAVVLVREDRPGERRLVAYVAAAGEPAGLAAHLRERLPDYMVPAVVVLPFLPLSPHGKVDSAALSRLAPEPREEEGWVAPSGEVEVRVAEIWAEVLGRDRIGATDDFFQLGGHSLLATRVVSLLRQGLRVELPVRALFEAPTVASLARTVEAALPRPAAAPPLRRVARGGALPLSFAQERLWFFDRLEPGSAAYNIAADVALAGRLDLPAFRGALGEICRRHEALRSRFVSAQGRPLQETLAELDPGLPVVDLGALAPPARAALAGELAAAEARRPFDLATGPLVRSTLLRLAAEEHRVLFTQHHIVSDGWSMGVFVRELAALYGSFVAGRPSPLPELALQYPDFAQWQREYLAGGVLGDQLAYWRQRLSGAPVLALPTDRPRRAVQRNRGGSLAVTLPPKLAERLLPFAGERSATPFMALLAVFQALLGRLAGQADLVVGSPVANRTHRELEGLIGFFVNTLALRTSLAGDPGFDGLLAQVRETALAAYAHQDLPFERLVEELAPDRSLSRSPLFQVMFALQNAPMAALALPGLELALLPVELGIAKFDLTLMLTGGTEGFSGILEYDRDLFDPTTAERLAGHLVRLLAGALATPALPLSRLSLLSAAEEAQLCREWNDTGGGPAADGRVHERVAAWARRQPAALAIASPEGGLSYGELDRRADRLAQLLSARGVGPEVPVAVCAEPGPRWAIALLAILKAGGAYVALDPGYPAERLAFVLADSGAPVILTERRTAGRLPARMANSAHSAHSANAANAAEVIEIEALPDLPERAAPPVSNISPASLAYVIYTSGSTGRPKGVLLSHAGLENFVAWYGEAFSLAPGDRATQMASPAFDASVLELWPCLAAGASLHVADWETRLSATAMLRFWARHEITLAFLPTPLAEAVLEELDEGLEPAAGLSLRTLATGGDRLHRGTSPETPFRLVNLYGPTESTVVATAAPLPAGSGATAGLPPIGRPLAGTRVRVLDRTGAAVPLGVPGELHLGGASLARGYLGRPDLTAERFVPDPWGRGERLYRTGDLVRHRPDGSLDFLGRIDHQVKIRGFRIELGEIEAAVAGHPGVAEAAVLAVGEGEKRRLAAFVVARPGGEAALAPDLRRALGRLLPDYMVPSLLEILPALPATAHGKVDRQELARRALAPVTALAVGAAGQVQGPRTPTEELVAGAFREILGSARFGVDESFFELGGHSLMATRVVARLESAFGVELPLRLLFESPTVAGLAREIEAALSGGVGGTGGAAGEGGAGAVPPPILPMSPIPRDRPLPLSFAQERLWFLDRLQPGSAVYNVPVALRLVGRLELPALRAGMDELARRHEALRTTFAELPGGAVQVIAPRLGIPVPAVDLARLPGELRAATAQALAGEEARRPFDLGRGPLVRSLLLRLEEGGAAAPGEHLLLLSCHHIVADGWSMGVIVRELTALYAAALAGRPSPLPELPIQYADFACWQRQWLAGDVLAPQLAWWWEALAGAPTLLDLPGDRPRPPVASGHGGAAPLLLAEDLVAGLAALARRHGVTLYMTLFSGLGTLLSRLSGQADLLVGTPVANRTRLEIEGLIGFFVNTLALRADLSGDPGFPALLARVRAMALGAYARQDLPFERLVEALQPDRSAGAPPIFQVLFVLQNAPLGRLALPGLVVEPVDIGTGTAKFDLTLALLARGERLVGSLEYNRDLFDAATAARFAGQLTTLLRGVAEDPERRVSELPLLSAPERQAVLLEWNSAPGVTANPAAHAAADITAPILARARDEGDRAAVSCQGEVLTYGELARRAHQLARHLVGMGVGTDTILGLCLDRSLDMAVAVLAALEAGIAYLPLDPAYPPERLALMLDDCAPPVLLTQAALLPGLAPLLASRPAPPRVFCLDTGRAAWTAASAAPLPPRAQPENLIYLVYTSGSTGRPKGIAMMRQALANLLAWQEGSTSLGAPARTLQFALLSFDVSFQEFVSTWRCGGTVVLLAEETRRDAAALLALLARERIERLYLPSIVLRQLAEVALERDAPFAPALALADVITAGEQLQVTPALIDWFRTLPPGCRLHNQYGPSEAHAVTAVTLTGDGAGWPALPPVGRTIANLRVYLLDPDLGPVPAGVPGEVGVAGIALARGYLGRPDLTAEKFVPDPLCGEPGARLYRTGDLARFRPDGQIEYLGRLDGQVKIRGFRIELGEVEAVLAQHPAVRGVAVVARDEAVTGARRLVAYVVCDALEVPGLREWLLGRLPDYMIPSAFVPLAALPLHPSGKLDRRALPVSPAAGPAPGSPGSTSGSAAGPAAGARSPIEEVLAGIWIDLLELEPAVRLAGGDDFFALGGHSLLATRVVSRVRAAFGVELPLKRLFESPTLAGMAAAIAAERAGRDARTAGEPLPLPPIRPLPAGPEFPLSFAQERLWFLDQLMPGAATYNMPAALGLRGRLDVRALAATLAGLTARHETLRTTFAVRGGQPVQAIAPPAAPALPLVDLGGLAAAARGREVRRLAAGEASRPFDLAAGPLLRATLLRLGALEHAALFTLHHIISDGWSVGVLVSEVAALYSAAVLGTPPALSPLPIQYRDFAVWQREWLTGAPLAAQLAWWRERLAGAPALLELPLDRPRPSVQRYRGARRLVHLPGDLAEGVRALCREAGATPFMTLLAAFEVLLSRLSGQADVAVGSPIAGRSQREVEGLIGFFVNTLVLRSDLREQPPFRRLLDRVREGTLGAYAHQDLPFDRLVEELRPERDLAYAPLFQVMFALQNAPMGALRLPGLELEPLELEVGAAKFDLVLSLGETAGGLEGGLGYNRDLFDPTTAERIAGHFCALLRAAVADPERPVDELPLLTAPERHQLLREWRGESREYPGSGLLHELFAAQAARTPEAPAVGCAGRWLSYGELDSRADRLASRLRAVGVGPESLVGVCLSRSFDLVAGLLGILKAGAAYVPLDPSLPAERLAFLIDDARLAALWIEEGTAGLLPASGVPGLRIDEADPAGDQAVDPSPLPMSADHPAYVIYTSGSTGKPKGVVIPHRAIAARLRFACADDLHPGERMIQKTTLSFDVSVFEVFAPLLTGGRLILPRPGGEKDPAYLLALAAEHGVTRLSFPPSLLSLLLEQEALPALSSLRMVVTGGETVPPELPARFHSRMAAHLENRYGPTEATISVTAWRCPPGEAPGRLPIGRPIPVAEIYCLDPGFQPVPLGVAGELAIGGVCLARGYLGRPELTAESFVPHPFAAAPGERLYRTGDIARQRPDGAIEFLGRLDGQVKVRGFRVEIGEIEAALREHPDLQAAAVADRADPGTGSRRLIAWLVARPDTAVSPAEVREFLQGKIPAYMVPAAFVPLAALPLTPSGKVDRQALPEPAAEETAVGAAGFAGSAGIAGEAPRGPLEELLAGIWTDLLGKTGIFREASFFELGGHSLLATRAVSRVREALGVELPLRRLFEEPTLAGFAAAVEEARARGDRPSAPPLRPAERGERGERELPLSFAQERLWFLEQLEPEGASYAMPAAVRLRGRLDLPALEASLGAIVGRHEALRTTFTAREGRPRQVISPELPRTPVLLPEIDLSALPAAVRDGESRRLASDSARRPFDLAAGPLFRAALLRLGEEENAVLGSMHHIVSDGWSVGIFVRELAALYGALAAGRPPVLPPLPVQYADFAVWQRDWLAGEVLAAEIAWWRERLAGAPPALELPTDRPRPAVQRFRGAQLPFRWPADLSAGLVRLGYRRGVTPFMLLLAGFATLLHRWSGQEDLVVGSPVANRTRSEVEGLIGFFVNTLALRAELSGDPGFGELLGRLRETTLAAYAHQDLPFEKLVEALQPERSLARTPLFQVLLVLQNAGGGELSLPGLTLSPVETATGTAKFDLTLSATASEAGFAGGWEFDRDLFDPATVARLADHLERLLAGAVADPEARLADLPLLSEAERQQLAEWNATAADFPERTLPALLAEQAARTPEAIALVFADESLSYAELAARAGRLAGELRRLGVGPEVRVGICAERSLALLVGLTAILAAGGAYVPLDPSYPAERLAFMLKDSGVPVLLTGGLTGGSNGGGLAASVPSHEAKVLSLDAPLPAATAPAPPAPEIDPDHLAYVLYTSGSTGRPKGAMNTHRGIVNRLLWMQERYRLGPQDRVLQKTPISFDVSVWELFWPLLTGACLVVARPGGHRDPAYLVETIRRREITFLHFVPALLAAFLEAPGVERCVSLRQVVASGEELPADLERRFFSRLGTRLENLYGPTEAAVDVTFWPCDPAGTADRVPIGRPVANTALHLLGRDLQPVPPGAVGELCIGGVQVARGYLGRPDLTAERFVPDPFAAAGGRLYRTGDLVRHRPSGELDFLGRIDHQVKIRGFRVELGEIEAALAAHPAVERSVVVVREDRPGDRRLVAYAVVAAVVPGAGGDGLAGELRASLEVRLPGHMIPSAFVLLPALPLTPNGKVDRRALPAPEWRAGADAVAPRTPLEEVLAGIWCEVLGVERVSVRDDFFRLGGHSLLATQLIARMRQMFQVELPLRRLFETPTIEALALAVEAAEARPGQSRKIARVLLKAKELRERGPRGSLVS